MASFNYERLVYNARPHPALGRNWSTYNNQDFADSFLPFVSVIRGKEFSIYDGAELFSNMQSGQQVFSFVKGTPLQVTMFSYPEAAAAADATDKLVPEDFEVACFAKTDSEDKVTLAIKFGQSVKQLVTTLASKMEYPVTQRAFEKRIYTTDRLSLDHYFKGEIQQKSLISFLFEIFEIPLPVSEDTDSPTSTEGILFDAGRDKAKKENPLAYAHGDITQRGLKEAGYSDSEIDKVYLGNWLRDYSSIICAMTVGFKKDDLDILKNFSPYDTHPVAQKVLQFQKQKLTYDGLIKVIRVLTIKEFIFNRTKYPKQDFYENESAFNNKFGQITKEMVGLYRPEEHIDNPKKLEDESILGNFDVSTNTYIPSYKALANPVAYDNGKGPAKLQTLYPGEGARSLPIDWTHKMKCYIKTGVKMNGSQIKDPIRGTAFDYFSEQLRLAARHQRDSREGLRHLGAALHVLEDYYAHSNFIELYLIKKGYVNVYPWVNLSSEVKNIKEGWRRIQKIPVVTGTFGPDDSVASLAPKIAEEFFPPGIEDYVRINSHERTFSDILALTLLEELAEKEQGLAPKDKANFSGYTVDELLWAYNEFLKYRDAWREVVERDPTGVLELISKANHYLFQLLKFLPNLLFNFLISSLTDGVKEQQDLANYGTDPTHTQIAKDNVNHPLNPLAGYIASRAVYRIGTLMIQCWAGKKSVESIITLARQRYFVHPSHTHWASSHISDWLKAHPNEGYDAVKKSEQASIFKYYQSQISKITKRTIIVPEEAKKQLEEHRKQNKPIS